MEFYYYFCLIIVITTLIHIYKRKNALFCISNIVLIIFNLIFVISPLTIDGNPIVGNYQLLIYLLVGFFIMLFVFNRRHPIKNYTKTINLTKFGYNRTLSLVLILFILRIIYLVLIGEYNNLLTQNRSLDRLESYYEDDFDIFSIFKIILINFFFIIASLCGQNRIGHKKIILGFILISVEAIAISNHRSPIIIPIILMMMFIHIYIKPFKAIVFVGMAFLVILFMSISAYIRVGNIDLGSNLTVNQQVAHGLRGLNTSESFSEMQEEIENGSIKHEYGFQLWLDLITPIPRIIWKEKPNVSFSSRMTEKMYGRIGEGNWVRTFTVWGEGYSQFGFAGILLYSFFLSYGLRKLIYFLSGFEGMEIMLMNFIVTLPLLIRTDLFAVYSRVLTLLIVLGIVILIFGYRKYVGSNSIYEILIK